MYSTIAAVKKKAGNPNEHDITEADYIEAIESADTIIRNSTQHDWVEGEPSFSLARNYFVSNVVT